MLDRVFIGMKLRVSRFFNSLVRDESGDTNFISVIIILAIALVVAGVFIGFKDTLVAKVKTVVDNFNIK